MNANRLINMALRMLMRRGIGAAVNRTGRKGRGQTATNNQTPGNGINARETGRKAGRALRVMRRFMR